MRNKLAAVLIALLLLTGCGTKTVDISAYGNTPITVSGLTDEEIIITPDELARLGCVSRTGVGATEKSGSVDGCGPLLNTFLEQYGCSVSDFAKIRFLCRDGYKIVLKKAYLTEHDVILAVSGRDDPLPETWQPLRILIPEGESSLWAYAVIRIELERETA